MELNDPLPNPEADPADSSRVFYARDSVERASSNVPAPNPYLPVGSSNQTLAAPAQINGGDSLRWWTPLVIVLVSFPIFFIASGIFAVVALVLVHGTLTADMFATPESFLDVSRSRLGLFTMVVLPQFVMVIPAMIAAWMSPTPWMRRLSLVRGHWPLWGWAGAAIATPLVALISGVLVGQFMEESENLRQMSEIFRGHGKSGFLIPLALMIGITPAICEEILFRGYVQTRWSGFHPLLAIVLSSFFFAVYHFDPVHVAAVFPMGLYLGFVSWRSGSLAPAMLGHFVNNFLSVVLMVAAPEEDTDVLAAPMIAASLGIIFLGSVGAACTVAVSYWFGPATNPETPTDPDSNTNMATSNG